MKKKLGRPKKGTGDSTLQTTLTFPAEEKGQVFQNFVSGKRHVTYKGCIFTGRCRVGAYCVLIAPVIQGELYTGGSCQILSPRLVGSGELHPGMGNTISAL